MLLIIIEGEKYTRANHLLLLWEKVMLLIIIEGEKYTRANHLLFLWEKVMPSTMIEGKKVHCMELYTYYLLVEVKYFSKFIFQECDYDY